MTVRVARMRWRAAEDRLYPALLADPGSYRRSMTAIQAVVAELRGRAVAAGGGVEALLAAEAAPFEVVAAACPDGVAAAPDLVVAVACGTVDRELAAATEQARRAALLDTARAEGRAWAVVDGPADVAELTEGRVVAVHVASGAVVQASIDPWARGEAFGLDVSDGESRAFGDRAAWLAAFGAAKARIEAAT